MTLKRNANKENVPPKERFRFSFDDDKFSQLAKGYQPPNTLSNTSWALRVFEEWRASRNAAAIVSSKTMCALKMSLLRRTRIPLQSGWVSLQSKREGRTVKSILHVPSTSYFLVFSAIYETGGSKQDNQSVRRPEFAKLQNVCDCHFRDLHSSGIGQKRTKRLFWIKRMKTSFGKLELLIWTHHRGFAMHFFL